MSQIQDQSEEVCSQSRGPNTHTRQKKTLKIHVVDCKGRPCIKAPLIKNKSYIPSYTFKKALDLHCMEFLLPCPMANEAL